MFHQLFVVLLPTIALSLPGKRKAAAVETSTTFSLPTAIPEPVLSEPVAKKHKFNEEYDAPAPVLSARKQRGYVSEEEANAAYRNLLPSG
jgi:hypothetical protein